MTAAPLKPDDKALIELLDMTLSGYKNQIIRKCWNRKGNSFGLPITIKIIASVAGCGPS